jgi:acyl transferase domain-containing protein
MTEQISGTDSATDSATDIAIVGMSGRFPGAEDVGELWTALRAGRSGITRFTDDELRAEGVAEELLADPAYVRAAPVVTGVEMFDADFFGVGPKDAQILDPQQRLFLEHAWEALEDAGCDPGRFDGAVGVFAGSAWSSYLQNNLLPAGTAAAMGELAVGLANDKDSLATRVAHTLGLSGPAYGVQSYCSTSLVAVCAAATSLAAFESDLALAGGVAVTVPHRVGYLYQEGGIAPPDGECRAFDAAGLGSPLGSGVGVVALRRLGDALDAGDRIYAVLRGWAVNNDAGRKVGFTAPGVAGQAAVVAEALAAAGLDPADIDYVATHGTGTALGDAAEIAALQQVFAGQRVAIGSIKPNIGHLDRAAGVANLITAALALHHGEIPPTRNLTTPNPQLRAGDAELEVVTEARGWPRRTDRPRRAGVSAFGIGGTNAHVVLEEAPLPSPRELPSRPEVLVWSAPDTAAADAMTGRLATHLADLPAEVPLADVAHTLQTGRQTFARRRVLVADSASAASAALAGGDVLTGHETRTDRPVGFLVAGAGEQYPGMAGELYRTEPVFRTELDRCRALLDDLTGTGPLTDFLAPRRGGGDLAGMLGRTGATRAPRTALLHPGLFAVEYSLAQLVRSWGVEPAVLAGYSLGEYVAACLAGVLDLGSALALVSARARLIDALPPGAMSAVPLSSADLRDRLAGAGLAVDVAAENGPELTVIAGPPEDMAAASALLADQSVPSRPLATSHAFHSRMLEPARAGLIAWITDNITLAAPRVPYVSNVTGAAVTAAQATDPAFWAEHMCAPVRFDAVLATLLADDDLVLLEIGPGPSLGTMARAHRDCPPGRWPRIVPTLPAAGDPRPAAAVLAEAAGRLWLAGAGLDWTAYQGGRPVAKTGLPAYPFQRQRYWVDPPKGTPAVAAPPERDGAPVELLVPRWTTADLGPAEPVDRCVLLADPADAFATDLARALRAAGTDAVINRDATGADAPVVVDLRPLASDVDGPGAVAPAVATMRRLGDDGARATRVIVVTRGGTPGQAAVAALPLVANQEYLNLDCRTVEVEPGTAPEVLAAEVTRPGTTPLVAYLGGQRHVRGFVAAQRVQADRSWTGGTYLITGGLGDVGLLIAGHLARAGARRIVLTSRGGPAGARQEAVDRLREQGVEVLTPAARADDLDAMRSVLAEVGPLDGVLHAAADTAVDAFLPLRDVDGPNLARHFDAKVGGAIVLERLLAELPEPPRFCLLFSSTAALLGGITFGPYAAANAALTAVARRNTGGRTRWLVANWDTWSVTLAKLGGGMGAAMAAHAMSTSDALAALDAIVAGAEPEVVVAAGGLDDRLPRAAASTVSAAPAARASGQRFARPDLPQPYRPPRTPTERALAELWSDVLGVEPVGTRDNFFDLGGTSLVGLQMLTVAKKTFGVAVPSVALFEGPTVHALAAILDEQGVQAPPVEAAPTPVATTTPRETPPDDKDGADDHRIAVVGMAGRFPGAEDVDTFWRNLRDGVESISFFTEEELTAAGVAADVLRDPNYVPARPVLDDIAGFDAGFFGMSPRMAALTDPQQRAFLEVCWEALEQAGYAEPEHRGRVGVFGGANISTYLLRMGEHLLGPDSEVSHYEVIMGNDKDALTTTVSYLFDLHGPSVAVQTFCSTSLVATHLAVRALRAGECELALAGGVSIRVPDRIGHVYGPGGMESPDGHVRTFDAQARGSMFGDGAAVVVLKRLSAALRDGDHIWSVIRGTAMNNDGALKVGYTAPSVTGQARVIADALADAGVTGEDISYIEAHGTATELGDPIEVAALTRAFGTGTTTGYCPIGSVKTNVGHLDRAAGASGLIKTSLALTARVIPPSLHYTSPNPEIDFEHSPFYVNTELSEWRTRDGRPRIAGINSLGMGGTNVHTVVEEAPARSVPAPADPGTARRYQVLPLSARTATAADEARRRLGAHLAGHPEVRLADVAYTLQVGRRTFEHRRALVSADVAAAAAALTEEPAAAVLSRVDAMRGREVAFLFAGVGEQYPGLVGELYRREPVFRAALDECAGPLEQLLGTELTGLVTGGRGTGGGLAALLGRAPAPADERAELLSRTEIAQPAVFAVEYALASTLRAWGVRPSVMLGYSLGEYVAACLSGVLSLPDALALVAHRAALIATVPEGAMLAVSLPVDALKDHLARYDLDVAAVNGPEVTVVAGPPEPVVALAEELLAAGIPCRRLATTHAFHSRMLEPVAAALTEWVRTNVAVNAPALPYVSNLTGELATAELVRDHAYWARHMCGTVRFADGVATLLADEELAVLEIGPGQSLAALVRGAGCPPARWPLVLSALPGSDDPTPDDKAFASALARLWLSGADIDWRACHGRDGDVDTGGADPRLPGRVPLPTYPFQRQRYWMDPPARTTRLATTAALPDPGDLFDAIAALPRLPEEQWLYLPGWRRTPRPVPDPAPPGEWLVLARPGIAEEVLMGLRDRLAASGAAVTVARPGDAYGSPSPGEYTVAPGSVADLGALLRDRRALGREPARVVHLWALDTAPGDQTVHNGLHTLVAFARAAGEAGLADWALDIVVAGTHEVAPGDVHHPDAATLLGPNLVLGLECPAVRSRLVDLSAEPSPAELDALVTELLTPPADPVVALRHTRRWTPTYEQMPVPSDVDTSVLRDGGVYLITGGLGGIALGMAERLAATCRAKLVLLARNGLPDRDTWPAVLAGQGGDKRLRHRVAAVSGLLDLGAEVEIVVGDVADAADVRRAVGRAVERFGGLHGVLHVAGVPGIGLMQFKQPHEVDPVLAPKVAGTKAIADALRIGTPDEHPLDFLVLFSSITSATGGGPGQVDYCAANAFLDSYAQALAAGGRRVLSVNWGEWTWNAWEEGLEGYDDALATFFRENRARIGIGVEDGWRSLLRALASREPRVVVSTQDFPALVAGSRLFTIDAVLAPPATGGDGAAGAHPRPDLVTPYQEPAGEVEESIAGIWRDSLRMARVGVLDNFFELGGNSLLGVSIVAAMRRGLDLADLPPHVLYEAPTVAALAKVVDALRAGVADQDTALGGSHVRAQLRRSGLGASAARRRGRGQPAGTTRNNEREQS